jgi:hypothetical protein
LKGISRKQDNVNFYKINKNSKVFRFFQNKIFFLVIKKIEKCKCSCGENCENSKKHDLEPEKILKALE